MVEARMGKICFIRYIETPAISTWENSPVRNCFNCREPAIRFHSLDFTDLSKKFQKLCQSRKMWKSALVSYSLGVRNKGYKVYGIRYMELSFLIEYPYTVHLIPYTRPRT